MKPQFWRRARNDLGEGLGEERERINEVIILKSQKTNNLKLKYTEYLNWNLLNNQYI